MLDRGDQVQARIPPPAPSSLVAESIPLDILFENQDVIVVNKPAGMVVHPAAGHASGTLVHAALAHAPEMEGIGGEQRPGVVHRLDKETSGVLSFARTAEAHRTLNTQFEQHRVTKVYHALVIGNPAWHEQVVDLPLRPNGDRHHRTVVDQAAGKPALTRFKVLQRFTEVCLLEATPETGRTHQIRAHLSSLGLSILGDKLYAPRDVQPPLDFLHGMALHAKSLTITHPVSGERMVFEAPYPDEWDQMLEKFHPVV
jgi:23S rRNA pseudouridine1911/1915/1917 synthase